MKKIKVLIVDDIKILRQGLKVVLEQDDDIEVVSLASNGKEAFEKCGVYEPDVVLMDMRMPDYDGAYGITNIKENYPTIKVLVLTTFDDDETIEKAVNSGADGYILKEMEDSTVISSVKSVHAGISVFGEGVYKMMRGKMGQVSNAPQMEALDEEFSERELEIIKLVAQGYDNKEIATQLYLASGTVRNQLSRILEKLNLKDRTQLAVYAVKHGID